MRPKTNRQNTNTYIHSFIHTHIHRITVSNVYEAGREWSQIHSVFTTLTQVPTYVARTYSSVSRSFPFSITYSTVTYVVLRREEQPFLLSKRVKA